jgi:hypothetical protein
MKYAIQVTISESSNSEVLWGMFSSAYILSESSAAVSQ